MGKTNNIKCGLYAKGEKMLEIQNICFERDNKKILDNISLNVDTDKFVVITGPNGSRKINTC